MTRTSDREKASPLRTIMTTFLLAISAVATVAQAGVLERRISTSYDDAEERANGSVSRGDSDLEMVFDKGGNQTVGVRFPDLTIPQGATVTSAWIQFTTDEKSTTPTNLVIDAAASDTTKPFKTTKFSISSLPRTTAKTNWSPQAWNVIGESAAAQRTPDLSAIIGEVVTRPGWSSGNAITLVVAGSGERVAESFNGDAAAAPLLHVEFTGGYNTAPSVDAGADVNITLPQNSVALDATVSDDGLPENSTIATTWSHVGGTGAGSVTFGDIHAVDTTVTFSADPGTYILRLDATDGELPGTDELVIQLFPAGVASAIQSIAQINYFDTGYDAANNPLPVPSTDPAGVLYDESTGRLIISDSEINEIPEVWDLAPYNMFETSITGNPLYGKYDVTPAALGAFRNQEPTGIAYCANDGYYYISNDDNRLIYRYAFSSGSGFTLVDTGSTANETHDPEGITCDPATGKLYVIGGKDINIVVYRYSNGFVVDKIIDLNATAGTPAGIPSDPEGIAFDAASGHLFVMSNDDDAIFEYTDTGIFLKKFDISGFSPKPKQPQGLSIGPSSVNSGKQSFYIADGMVDNNYDPNERDGRIFEAEITR